jgi:hypothetical protein
MSKPDKAFAIIATGVVIPVTFVLSMLIIAAKTGVSAF